MDPQYIPEKNFRNLKKYWTHEIPTRKNVGPTKHPRKKLVLTKYPQGKKFWTYKLPTRKILGLSKYPPEKLLDPHNTYEKKCWTSEISMKKNLGPTKAQWHETYDSTSPTEISTINILLILNCVNIKLGTGNKHYVRKSTLTAACSWV